MIEPLVGTGFAILGALMKKNDPKISPDMSLGTHFQFILF
jgi:hypothetical protein